MQPASDEDAFNVKMLVRAVAEAEVGVGAGVAGGVGASAATPIQRLQARENLKHADELNLHVRELCVKN